LAGRRESLGPEVTGELVGEAELELLGDAELPAPEGACTFPRSPIKKAVIASATTRMI
jgi:hypothetical protein